MIRAFWMILSLSFFFPFFSVAVESNQKLPSNVASAQKDSFTFTYEGETFEFVKNESGGVTCVGHVEKDDVLVYIDSLVDGLVEFDLARLNKPVKIPAEVCFEGQTFPVTNVDAFSFSFVSHVVIPNTVKTIDDGAFVMSFYLSRVDIPNSVTHIGNSAFSSSSIKKIDIPQSVESIGEDAFGGTEIKRIKLPEGLDSIKKKTFSSCSQLKRMVIPKSVVSIGKYAFRDCKKLKSISIPQSVNSIEYGAFWGCLKLKKIKISPKNQHFFSRRGGLYTKSGDTLVAFLSMNRRNRKILKTVKHIGEGAFAQCEYLRSFVIPKGVETIGDGAFQRCEFDELVIPNTVTSIGNYVFAGSYFEDALKIPNSVKSLGDYVFDCCNGEAIILPNSVTSIGNFGFSSGSLDEVILSESLKKIGKGCFYDCSIKKLVIPQSVESIGEQAFCKTRCLEYIEMKRETPPSIASGVFEKSAIQTIYVPAESVEKYKTAEGWSEYAEKIRAIESNQQ